VDINLIIDQADGKKRMVSIRLDEKEFEVIETLAKENNCSLSDVLRGFIKAFAYCANPGKGEINQKNKP